MIVAAPQRLRSWRRENARERKLAERLKATLSSHSIEPCPTEGRFLMATTKTLEHEAKKAGQAAGETAEATGKALKETGDRTARATVDDVEHVTKTATDAAERTAKAAADTVGSMAETMADSLDAETIISTTRESIAVATRT
jgi:ribonuclease D